MTNDKTKNHSTVLGLWVNTHGIHYALCTKGHELIGTGTFRVKPTSKRSFQSKISRLIDYYRPDIVTLESVNTYDGRKSQRLISLVEKVNEFAQSLDLETYRYTTNDVKEFWSIFQIKTKYQKVEQLCKWYPELQEMRPPIRKVYEGEHYNMGKFDALGLVLCCYYRLG